MSRCRHFDVVAYLRCDDPLPCVLAGDDWRHHAKVQCATCRATLPLGPANDTPETAVEVEAARIAATREPSPLTDAEWDGWTAYTFGCSAPTGATEQAGWLAAAIYTHKEDDRD